MFWFSNLIRTCRPVGFEIEMVMPGDHTQLTITLKNGIPSTINSYSERGTTLRRHSCRHRDPTIAVVTISASARCIVVL